MEQRARRHGARRKVGHPVRQAMRLANIDAGTEAHAFLLHLRDPAIDQPLLHFEVGDAVTEQTAGPIVLFEYHDVVADASELLCARKAGGSRAHYRNSLTALALRRQRRDPAHLPSLIDNRMLDRLDADRVVVDV